MAAQPLPTFRKVRRPLDNDFTVKPRVTTSQIDTFHTSYPLQVDYPFLPSRPDAPTIDADTATRANTYRYVYAAGMNTNIPVPSHPMLYTQGDFYMQLAYLFEVATPFTQSRDIGNVTEESLSQDNAAWGTTARKLRRALSRSKCIVVDDTPTILKADQINLADPLFQSIVGMPDRVLDVQDMVFGQRNGKVTMKEFFNSMNDPRQILNVLELNGYGRLDHPSFIRMIYDDVRVMQPVIYSADTFHIDHLRTRQWMLYGQAFSHTLLHHDTVGYSTFVTGVKGVKLWYLLVWTVPPTPELWLRRYALLAAGRFFELEHREKGKWISEKGDKITIDYSIFHRDRESWEDKRVARWVVVRIEPGKSLVMPPNQPHFVYNVHEAFAMGGHGLNWEALPLTEVSSRMDSLTATIANDVHGGFPSVIQAFALALPRNLKEFTSVLGHTEDQIAALVRMILQPDNYRQLPSDKEDLKYIEKKFPDIDEATEKKMREIAIQLNIRIPRRSRREVHLVAKDFEWAPSDVIID